MSAFVLTYNYPVLAAFCNTLACIFRCMLAYSSRSVERRQEPIDNTFRATELLIDHLGFLQTLLSKYRQFIRLITTARNFSHQAPHYEEGAATPNTRTDGRKRIKKICRCWYLCLLALPVNWARRRFLVLWICVRLTLSVVRLCVRERGRAILCSVFFYSVPSSSLSIPSFLSPQILLFFSFFLLNFVVSRKDVLCNNAVQSKGMNGKMGVKNMGLRMLNW